MKFRVLGRLEVSDGEVCLDLGPPKQRLVLAALLLKANHCVPVDHLVDMLWGKRPPQSAAGNLQTYVSGIRRALRTGGADAKDRVGYRPGGYVLHASPDEVDSQQFVRVADAGRQSLRRGDLPQAISSLRAALAHWRGAVLEDLQWPDTPPHEAAHLEEVRLTTIEDLNDARIAAGQHGDVAIHLSTLAAHHPGRERIWEQLMLALHRSGRRAEALKAYATLHDYLADELGVAPCESIQRLHLDILRCTGVPDAGSGPAVAAGRRTVPDLRVSHRAPHQLPPKPSLLIGRGDPHATIVGHLRHAAEHGRAPAEVVVVDGAAGVGTSALAVHAAHEAAAYFPDGQLYVDFSGRLDGGRPLGTRQAIGQLLRTLGVEPPPGSIAEAAAALRSSVAGRKLLLVLDNVRDAGQVRALRPAAHHCAAVVATRDRCGVLDAVTHVHLEPLSDTAAVELLESTLGPARISPDTAACVELARLCDHLPFALLIAVRRLLAHPSWTVRDLVVKLSDERLRLAELQFGGQSARGLLGSSYLPLLDSADDIDRAAARALLRLALCCGGDFTDEQARRAIGCHDRLVDQLLERLQEYNLIQSRRSGGYRVYGLTRRFAAEQATGTLLDAAHTPASHRHEAVMKQACGVRC